MPLTSGTGLYETDWGVSSDRGASKDVEQIRKDFAPPSRPPNRKLASKGMKPLVIVNENISRTAKFYSLFIVFAFAYPSFITCRHPSQPTSHLLKPVAFWKDYGISFAPLNFYPKNSLLHRTKVSQLMTKSICLSKNRRCDIGSERVDVFLLSLSSYRGLCVAQKGENHAILLL
jgi:hypothetical protein